MRVLHWKREHAQWIDVLWFCIAHLACDHLLRESAWASLGHQGALSEIRARTDAGSR